MAHGSQVIQMMPPHSSTAPATMPMESEISAEIMKKRATEGGAVCKAAAPPQPNSCTILLQDQTKHVSESLQAEQEASVEHISERVETEHEDRKNEENRESVQDHAEHLSGCPHPAASAETEGGKNEEENVVAQNQAEDIPGRLQAEQESSAELISEHVEAEHEASSSTPADPESEVEYESAEANESGEDQSGHVSGSGEEDGERKDDEESKEAYAAVPATAVGENINEQKNNKSDVFVTDQINYFKNSGAESKGSMDTDAKFFHSVSANDKKHLNEEGKETAEDQEWCASKSSGGNMGVSGPCSKRSELKRSAAESLDACTPAAKRRKVA
eukprot:gnl/MRDRNA2_/MRDRNA2_68113_c0_seq1.p1 gnl/MRDRNA2_/MRDRNA2_68113_c0~~gnl/MRDRNA2_/MRDRNA2_68113_c0_seq1.p1  ORF type:complete len:380 (+),score=84.01 gnl/MRDRNA2_/MRDRNA2_68113_c0_seq1:148-1140(+)